LKPKAPTTGYVDGGWWPYSDDLPTELPDLPAVLSVRLGPIDRVIYNLTEWAEAPNRLSTGGRVVRLGGYYRQPAQTDPDHAHAIMMAAATREDASTMDGLLATRTQNREAGASR
jgi:hypothetical protein